MNKVLNKKFVAAFVDKPRLIKGAQYLDLKSKNNFIKLYGKEFLKPSLWDEKRVEFLKVNNIFRFEKTWFVEESYISYQHDKKIGDVCIELYRLNSNFLRHYSVSRVIISILSLGTTISYSADEHFRSKSITYRLCKKGLKKFKKIFPQVKKIVAHIRPGNEKSQNLARRLGFIENHSFSGKNNEYILYLDDL